MAVEAGELDLVSRENLPCHCHPLHPALDSMAFVNNRHLAQLTSDSLKRLQN